MCGGMGEEFQGYRHRVSFQAEFGCPALPIVVAGAKDRCPPTDFAVVPLEDEVIGDIGVRAVSSPVGGKARTNLSGSVRRWLRVASKQDPS